MSTTVKGIILLGHGSRDPRWRETMDAVAMRIASQGVLVRCAFMELQAPDLNTAANELASEGATHLVVAPMFLGMGRHAREDLPRLVDDLRRTLPDAMIELRASAGEDARVLDLLAEIARG